MTAEGVQIPLTRGMNALVDPEDAEIVGQYKWYAHPLGDLWYARRTHNFPGRGWVQITMHRAITGWEYVDHINGDGLDNRRCNLREAEPRQNSWNSRKRRKGRFKGVYPNGPSWRIELLAGGRRVRVGGFRDEVAAALAYDDLVREHHGEYGTLNFPRPGERSAHR